MSGEVHALIVHNGELVAGGIFSQAGGQPANGIARWNGTSWQPLGTGTTGGVYALVSYNGDLIAGGRFYSIGGVNTGQIARWDGAAWQDMPVWIPPEGEYAGFGRVSSAKAQAAGLTYRPLETTVADTLAYWRGLPPDRRAKPKAGLSPEREAAVLAAYHASLAPPAPEKPKKKKRR